MALNTERLQKYAATFEAMKENGVSVPFTLDHSHSAEDVIGYVLGMYVKDGALFAVIESRGPKAALPYTVKDVSVEIAPNFVDGRGNQYGEAIRAVSLVKHPVMPGQSDFIPLGESPTRVLYLSMAGFPGRKDSAMPDDLNKKPGDKPEETQAASLETEGKGPDDSAPVKASADAMAPLATVAGSLGLEIPPGASLDEVLTTILATISTMKDAAKPAESSPTAEVLALSLDAADSRFRLLEGRELVFDAATIKRLVETVAGVVGNPNTRMLSLAASGKTSARAVADLLHELSIPARTVTGTPIDRMNFGLTPVAGTQTVSAPIGSDASVRETAKGRNLNAAQKRNLGITN